MRMPCFDAHSHSDSGQVTAHMAFHFKQHARLAIILSLSALAHLVIFFVLTWKFFGLTPQASIRVLTVSINRTQSATEQNPLAVESKTAAHEISVATGVDDKPAPANKVLPPAVDAHYFSITELDRPPNPADTLEIPDHPQEGEIIFRLWIDKTGKVIKVEPVTPELSQALIAGVRARFLNSRFAPGRRLGITVNSVREITLHDGRAE